MVVGGTVAASAAAAEPVNLRCSLDAPTRQRTIDITLNEADSTASWQWDNSATPLMKKAVFTAETVVLGTIIINRVTLAIEQANPEFLIKNENYPAITRGKCEIRKVARAF